MKPYTAITKDINKLSGNSKLSDAYIFACLYSTINYKTGKSKCNQNTIRDKFGIPESTFKDVIARLEKCGLLKIERKNYYKYNQYIRKNYYYMNINPINFFFLNKDYFKLNIDRNTKGFVLLLKTISLNNTNTYLSKKPINNKINKTELAKLLGITTKTLNIYLKEAKDAELIDISEGKIFIICEYIRLRVKEDERHSEIISTIQNICVKHKVEIPFFDKRDIDRIMFYYSLLESEIEAIGDIEFTKLHSLKYVLENRMKKLPKTFSIEYIFEALNIPNKPNKEPMAYEKLIMI